MAAPSTSGEGKNLDGDRTTAVTECGSQEGQLSQSITNFQSQLDAMSQRQDELMQLVGALREPQGSVTGTPGGVPGRAALPRGPDSYETLGPALPAGGAGGEPHTMQANHRPVPGHPATQQIPPSQSQVRGPGQPTFHHFDPNGRPLIHPLPPPPHRPFPPFPHAVPVFSQVRDRTGHVVGLVRRVSFTLSDRTGVGPNVRHVPPGWAHPQTYQPPVYPQIPPQIMMRGPMPMNWGAPPGPPPPYPGPVLAPGEPTHGTNQADPSTRHSTPNASGTSMVPQPRSLRTNQNDGPEQDGSGLDVPPVPGRERTVNVPTRANPPRRARPKDLSELH